METCSVVFTSPVNDIFYLLNNSHLEITDARAYKSNELIRTDSMWKRATGAKDKKMSLLKLSHLILMMCLVEKQHLFADKSGLVQRFSSPIIELSSHNQSIRF